MPLKKPKKTPFAPIKITRQTLSLFKQGKRVKGKCLDLYLKKNNDQTVRLGMIMPKKTIATAVCRNKLRRLIREDFKKDLEEFISYDILIVVTRKIEAQKDKLIYLFTQEWKNLKKFLLK